MSEEPDIVVTSEPLPAGELSRLVCLHFQDMVKFVVDVERGVVAVGGPGVRDRMRTIVFEVIGSGEPLP